MRTVLIHAFLILSLASNMHSSAKIIDTADSETAGVAMASSVLMLTIVERPERSPCQDRVQYTVHTCHIRLYIYIHLEISTSS